MVNSKPYVGNEQQEQDLDKKIKQLLQDLEHSELKYQLMSSLDNKIQKMEQDLEQSELNLQVEKIKTEKLVMKMKQLRLDNANLKSKFETERKMKNEETNHNEQVLVTEKELNLNPHNEKQGLENSGNLHDETDQNLLENDATRLDSQKAEQKLENIKTKKKDTKFKDSKKDDYSRKKSETLVIQCVLELEKCEKQLLNKQEEISRLKKEHTQFESHIPLDGQMCTNSTELEEKLKILELNLKKERNDRINLLGNNGLLEKKLNELRKEIIEMKKEQYTILKNATETQTEQNKKLV